MNANCQRPGCTGTYEPDGFCGTCGFQRPYDEQPVVPERRPTTAARASSPAGPGSSPAGPATGPAGPASGSPLSGRPASVPQIGPTTLPTGRGATTSTVHRSAHRGQVGAGLVDVPPVGVPDPRAAVLQDLQVPAGRRKCRQCGGRVGQPRGDQPGLATGYCPQCRTPFSFVPALAPGDVVARRYEILGCLAHGGLGWIYLARDRNLGDASAERWVVLKGLIDGNDRDAVEAAINERRFLVEVDHPNIVKIHDFAHHEDPGTGSTVGYIVMEYLGGRSLRELLREHRDQAGRRQPLPLPRVLAYGLDILTALEYLHGRGLVYCDLKPDNLMHAGRQLKLIDLGAVVRRAKLPRAFFSTVGYRAPEVATAPPADPSVASDLFTVGRTLAVLSFTFAGFTRQYEYRLPPRAEVPLLAAEDSYHRLLRRATHPDPARRFGSAEEMREQLHGVLLEVLCAADGQPRPDASTYFTPERLAFGTEAGEVAAADAGRPDPRALPVPVDFAAAPAALPGPQPDLSDPAAGFLSTLGGTDPEHLVEALLAAPERTPEVVLRLAEVRIGAGDATGAEADLAGYAAQRPHDWRLAWYRGLAALAGGRPEDARVAFEKVYDALPGEVAGRLALAAAAEWSGDDEVAERLYERIWAADPGYLSAAFGLARVLRRRGRWVEAVAALDRVSNRSGLYTAAQVAAVRTLLAAAPLTGSEVSAAADRLRRLELDPGRRARLAVEVFSAALHVVDAVPDQDTAAADPDPDMAGAPPVRPGGTVLGRPFERPELSLGLERAYRDLARSVGDRDLRIRLVDRANQVRPRTLV